MALPVFACFCFVGALATRWFGRATSSREWVGWALGAALGVVAGLTLTRLDLLVNGDVGWGLPANPSGDAALGPLSVPWPVDRVANFVLFVPLGAFAMLVGRKAVRRWLLVGVLLLPLLVETVQGSVGWLQRDAQWQDVCDNTLGVLFGMGIGLSLRLWAPRWFAVESAESGATLRS